MSDVLFLLSLDLACCIVSSRVSCCVVLGVVIGLYCCLFFCCVSSVVVVSMGLGLILLCCWCFSIEVVLCKVELVGSAPACSFILGRLLELVVGLS